MRRRRTSPLLIVTAQPLALVICAVTSVPPPLEPAWHVVEARAPIGSGELRPVGHAQDNRRALAAAENQAINVMHSQHIWPDEVGMKRVNSKVVNRRPPHIGFNTDNFRCWSCARDDATADADFFGFDEATSINIQRMLVGCFENCAIVEGEFTRPDVLAHAGVGHAFERDS